MELPTISKTNYASNALAWDDHDFAADPLIGLRSLNDRIDPMAALGQTVRMQQERAMQQIQTPQEHTMRIVRVIIADPNENIPLEKRILYSGEEKLTDLTDQELFYEVPISELLRSHNENVRSFTQDKSIKDRTEYLEPARIRDLRMVVVDIAKF